LDRAGQRVLTRFLANSFISAFNGSVLLTSDWRAGLFAQI